MMLPDSEKCLVMTVIDPGYMGGGIYFGSQRGTYKYVLKRLT